jgi:hypothetical protein
MEWFRIAIRVYLNTPELIYASLVLGGVIVGIMYAVGRICWNVRGQSALDNEKAMTTRLALAHDQQGVLEKKVAELTQQVASYVKALRTAPVTIHNPDEQQTFIASLLNQSATLTDSVKSIARSSHDLGTTLDTPWTQSPLAKIIGVEPDRAPKGGILDLDDLKKPVNRESGG